MPLFKLRRRTKSGSPELLAYTSTSQEFAPDSQSSQNSQDRYNQFQLPESIFTTGLEDTLNDFCLTSQSSQGINHEDTKACEDVVFKDESSSSKIFPETSKSSPDYQTPVKNSSLKKKIPTRVTKIQQPKVKHKTPKFYKNRKDLSNINLLKDASSPAADTPPALKFSLFMDVDPINYYSPKRSRSELESLENTHQKKKILKPLVVNSPPRVSKLINLSLKVQGNLGISLERKDTVRPHYIISKMDPNGDAAKSKQFWIGDEIVKVCGRRIRGTPEIEARNALRSCFGDVEILIARNPKFAFCGDFEDTWPEQGRKRTRSESEIWGLKNPRKENIEEVCHKSLENNSDLLQTEETVGKKLSCEIVGFIKKENIIDEKSQSQPEKFTGMKKFYKIRKKNLSLTPNFKKNLSLPHDLLIIEFEEGSSKKLGFSITGGSNSSKGNIGIYITSIESAGQAAEEGKLQNGDELIAVNGISMQGFTREKARDIIKVAKARKMILYVRRRGVSH